MQPGKVSAIINPQKKTGVGQNGTWTIKSISVQLDSGTILTADTFNDVNVGDAGTVEKKTYTKRDGTEGYSYNFNLPRQAGNVRSYTNSGGVDAQTLQTLVNMLKTMDGKLDKLIGMDAVDPEMAQAAKQAEYDQKQLNKDIPVTDEFGEFGGY